MKLAREALTFLSLLAIAACASAQPPVAVPVVKDCKPAATRAPAVLVQLDWIREAPRDERLLSGPAIAAPDGAAFDDPDGAASLSLTLREIDLDADGDCDLIGTATSGTGSAGGGRSHLVYWFADPQGWRRQGPMPGSGAKGLNPIALELFGPAGVAEMALFAAEGYAPLALSDGRIALVLRPQASETKVADLRVIAFDAKTKSMRPIIANVAARALQLCEKESPEAAVCATW
jgi:hypothetical protein